MRPTFLNWDHCKVIMLVFVPGTCVLLLATSVVGARGHPWTQNRLRCPQPVFSVIVLLMTPKTFRNCTSLVVPAGKIGSWRLVCGEAQQNTVIQQYIHSRVRGKV